MEKSHEEANLVKPRVPVRCGVHGPSGLPTAVDLVHPEHRSAGARSSVSRRGFAGPQGRESRRHHLLTRPTRPRTRPICRALVEIHKNPQRLHVGLPGKIGKRYSPILLATVSVERQTNMNTKEIREQYVQLIASMDHKLVTHA